jgi:hypothetical protein
MKPKHTPEPWSYDESQEDYVLYSDSAWIGKTSLGYGVTPEGETEANAARIVACVNACEGINPEAIPLMLEALKSVVSAFYKIPQADKFPSDLTAAITDASAAIAKTKGGSAPCHPADPSS